MRNPLRGPRTAVVLTCCLVVAALAISAAQALRLNRERSRTLIFVLAGQSNMSGRGALDGLPTFLHASDVFSYSNAGVWVQAAEPVDAPDFQVDEVSQDLLAGVGPSLAFGDRLATLRSGIRVGLVPAAKGSTRIRDWQRNLSRRSLYGSMLARAREAQRYGRLAGLVWYQGEADMGPSGTAEWPGRFTRLVEDFRRDIGIPDLPVVMTVLGPNMFARRAKVHADFVAMQRGMALPPGVIRVEATDLQGIPEDDHLPTPSYVALGRRYADALDGVLGDRDGR